VQNIVLGKNVGGGFSEGDKFNWTQTRTLWNTVDEGGRGDVAVNT